MYIYIVKLTIIGYEYLYNYIPYLLYMYMGLISKIIREKALCYFVDKTKYDV